MASPVLPRTFSSLCTMSAITSTHPHLPPFHCHSPVVIFQLSLTEIIIIASQLSFLSRPKAAYKTGRDSFTKRPPQPQHLPVQHPWVALGIAHCIENHILTLVRRNTHNPRDRRRPKGVLKDKGKRKTTNLMIITSICFAMLHFVKIMH